MRILLSIVVVLVALTVEASALLLLTLLGGPLDLRGLAALGGLHLFASVAAAEAMRLRYFKAGAARRGAWRLGLGLSLLFPGFGLLVCAILTVRAPRTLGAGFGLSPMEDRRRQAEAELAAEAQQGRADVNVEAIGDALKDTDKAKRIGAVEALRALQNKQAVALLSKSLRNTVYEVRYHAVEALAGIGKKHSERIGAAVAAAEREGTPEAYRALGETYFEYANLEMEEPSIQQHLFRNALASLQRSVTPGQPADPDVLEKIAASLEALGEAEQARHMYRTVLADRPRSFQALLGLARIQYRSGEFDQLRETCRKLLELPDGDPEFSSAILLWAEGPARAGRQVA